MKVLGLFFLLFFVPACIQGPQGEPGEDGFVGHDGINGKDGLNGQDGLDGKDGLDGMPGKDGVDGTNGQDGIDGKDAEQPTENPAPLGIQIPDKEVWTPFVTVYCSYTNSNFNEDSTHPGDVSFVSISYILHTNEKITGHFQASYRQYGFFASETRYFNQVLVANIPISIQSLPQYEFKYSIREFIAEGTDIRANNFYWEHNFTNDECSVMFYPNDGTYGFIRGTLEDVF